MPCTRVLVSFLNEEVAQEPTNCPVYSSFNGNVQLCSNAVSPTNQYGILVSGCLQIENATEAADLSVRPCSLCLANERLNPLDQGVPCIDRYSRVCVSQTLALRGCGSKSPMRYVRSRKPGILIPK